MRNFLLVFLMFGCIESDPLKKRRTAHNLLHENYELWKKIDLKHYSFEQKKDCFCIYPPYAGEDGWYTVEVEYTKDEVRPTIKINGDVVFDLPKGYVGVKMIEQLFDLIHDEIQEDYWNMRLQFDGIYGYPQYFYIDREEMLVDEEYSYEIRNFKVL